MPKSKALLAGRGRGQRCYAERMQQVVITRLGSPDVMECRDVPDPTPGAEDIQIAVKAIGVNFSDILVRTGVYPGAPQPPCVVGYEVAGIVSALGARTSAFTLGERVMAFTHFGGYSSMVVVPQAQVFRCPERLSFVQAAAIPVTYLTASVALYRLANLQEGETVLIHGAAGGVGTAAIQLARLRQARIIGTASEGKHEVIKTIGAHHMLDYPAVQDPDTLSTLTGQQGIDIVLDPLGGASLHHSYRSLAPLGRLVYYGASTALPGEQRRWWPLLRTFLQTPRFKPLNLLHDNRSVHGLHLGRLFSEIPKLTPLMHFVLDNVDGGRLTPIIAKTFPLAAAAQAHQYMHERANIGKVVLTTDSNDASPDV